MSELAPVGLEHIGECRVLRDVDAQPGVPTVEGTIVPLLSGKHIRSHQIVMHPGQYCYAHPHDTESIIYTTSGRWVFCTIVDGAEQRTVINRGDLFHFPGGVPTGFETPFPEGATILILKQGSESYDEMAAGLMGTKQKLDEDHAGGEPFYFRELGGDHPAREYARQVTGTDPGVTS
jgi:quercetin dioxygenase-like cupin family protein